jgi:hypothetical protein
MGTQSRSSSALYDDRISRTAKSLARRGRRSLGGLGRKNLRATCAPADSNSDRDTGGAATAGRGPAAPGKAPAEIAKAPTTVSSRKVLRVPRRRRSWRGGGRCWVRELARGNTSETTAARVVHLMLAGFE